MSLGRFGGSTSSCMGERVGMGLVMAADFLERVATDAVDNGEEASFVTQGGARLCCRWAIYSLVGIARVGRPCHRPRMGVLGGFLPSLP